MTNNSIIRKPAVSGTFYPENGNELEKMINSFLAKTTTVINKPPKAIISPHAGYIYSGQTAAHAYKQIEGCDFTNVLLLGPTHRVPFINIAASSADYFKTPLGDIPVNTEAISSLIQHPEVAIIDSAHSREHSLETQLPFLQMVLPKRFQIIPLLVGPSDIPAIEKILTPIIKDENTIIVVSSDLSHFHDYATANELDIETTDQIENLSQKELIGKQACGCFPINCLLEIARNEHMKVTTLARCNSGDSQGDKNSVVGYGAYAFEQQQ